MAKWHDGLTLRGYKSLTTKGVLFSKLFSNFKNITKTKLLTRELAETAGLLEHRYKMFVDGLFEDIPQEALDKLLTQIQMTWDDFKSFAKKTAIPGMGVHDPSLLVPPKETAPATQQTASHIVQKPPTGNTKSEMQNKNKTIQVMNFVEEALVLLYNHEDGILEIHPNYQKIPAKAKFKPILLTNSVLFGNNVVPGKGELK
jgi:hypothetical protein